MSVRFFSFSGLRRFLKQDLTSLSSKRYLEGFRQTYTCEDCGDVIYCVEGLKATECSCGRFTMLENKYHYKFEDLKNKSNTNHSKIKSIYYARLRRVKYEQ